MSKKNILIEENESNLFNLFKLASKYSINNETRTPCSLFSSRGIWPGGVSGFNYELNDYTEIVKELREGVLRNEYASFCFVNSNKDNKMLVEELEKQGYFNNGSWPCMSLDLSNLPDKFVTPSEFNVKLISDKEELKIWFKILRKELFNDGNIEYHIFENLLEIDNIYFFLGLYDNTAVSTAMLHIENQNAGLYMVSTKNEYRNKGFGSCTVTESLKFAKENNRCATSTLQATKDGEPRYKKIGFVEDFRHFFYKLKAE